MNALREVVAGTQALQLHADGIVCLRIFGCGGRQMSRLPLGHIDDTRRRDQLRIDYQAQWDTLAGVIRCRTSN